MNSEDYLQQIEHFYSKHLHEESVNSTQNAELMEPEKFYQHLMNLSADAAKPLHISLMQFLENPSDMDRSQIRKNLILSYWRFIEEIINSGHKFHDIHIKILIRFGITISSLVPKNVFEYILYADLNSQTELSIYYLDEWLNGVVDGIISQSVVENSKQGTQERNSFGEKNKLEQLQNRSEDLIEKTTTLSDKYRNNMDSLLETIQEINSLIQENEFGYLCPIEDQSFDGLDKCIEYIQNIKIDNSKLVNFDQRIRRIRSEIKDLQSHIDTSNKKSSNDENLTQKFSSVQSKLLIEELMSVKQMHKMCVGKSGNHIPILINNFFHGNLEHFATKERVLQKIHILEKTDYTIFFRRVQHSRVRMFPNILLLPCYGQTGICWEPFNFFQRGSTSAKFVIPMYSSNLLTTICYVMGDYRWQIAKEETGHRWTSEGLTGRYYQWAEDTKLKTSLKDSFIQHYIQWIMSESKGIGKLNKHLRAIFWKYIPFTIELKEHLKLHNSIFKRLPV